jgi:hypothetical protein
VTGRTLFLSLGLLVALLLRPDRPAVTAHNFSADGKRLFVLTSDQTAFEFDVPSEAICLQLSLFAASVRLAALIQR